ncbi:hypothetical protein SAY86_017398 [Trapa natans]|uniref:Uncharacterized protein n=1 Tax=Trapa natans TaxID=22666 RepID=A0AAN7LRZ5_TRANT|nr:hypothetical protein SAY86_017398 [Trapa natans]
MDSKHTEKVLKHFDYQSEMLTRIQRLMADELRKLQVEEEMLMRKLHKILATQDVTKKSDHKEDKSGGRRQDD